MTKIRIPHAVLSAVVSLPTCMPGIEGLNLVVYADLQEGRDCTHRADVDKSLMDLQHLREVRVSFECVPWQCKVTFEEDVRKKLPMANEAGLLSFCHLPPGALFHRMREFSN